MKTDNLKYKKEKKDKAKPSLKSRIGLTLIIIGFISPLFAILMPLLNLSPNLTAGLVTLFLVGVPELFLILGVALAGKEGLALVKNKIKKFFGLPEGVFAASKTQYRLAKLLVFLWLVGITVPYYFPTLMGNPIFENNLLYISIGGELMLIVAIFFLGGNQMVTKIQNLFTWEPWIIREK